MDDVLRLVLRCLGAFYLLAAILGLRAVATDRFLSQALAAISPGVPGAVAADRLRNRVLTASALLIGASSLALLALLDLSVPLLGLVVALQVAYLGYLAPRFVDSAEPPDPGARRRSVLATGVIAEAALLTYAASRRGLLFAPVDATIPATLATIGFAALCGYAVWLMRPWQRLPALGLKAEDESLPMTADDEVWEIEGSDPEADPATMSVVLTPSWHGGAIFDARSGRPLSHRARTELLTELDRDLLADWLCLFVDVADPKDPRGAALAAPDGLARLEALGRPISEAIAARLGADRVAFEPAPRPVGPGIDVAAVKVMADHGCDPLWFHDRDRVGCFSSSQFGLSWSLTCDLGGWAVAFDESLDRDDPGGAPRWSEAEAKTHEAEGRHLAERLAGELAATERAHVRVVYHPVGSPIETIAGAPA